VTGARPPLDPSLYLVTDTRLCGAKGVAETAREAVAAGATLVQLRDPDASDDEFVRLGRLLVSTLAGSGTPVLVNDRVHLVGAIVRDARRLLGPDAYLGLSVQHPEHVRAAGDERPDDIDYLGVGPLWAQTTKPDAVAPIGPDGFRDIARSSRWECVAIGGIDAGRIGIVRASGAAGVAVVSAICGQPDVGAATRRLRAAWRASP
jgi:thiamine-phosphate pyrophosphorylase